VLPLIPILIAGGATVIGSVIAYNLTKKDEYSSCVKDSLQAGVPSDEAVKRCSGLKEPSLIEKSITPMIIFAGLAIAGPPLIEAMRKKK